MEEHLARLIIILRIVYSTLWINTSGNRQGSLSIANKLKLRGTRLGKTTPFSPATQGWATLYFLELLPDQISIFQN